MAKIVDLFLQPPLAIARVGGSDQPLESFEWAADDGLHGGHETVIRPATTLEVMPDATLRPYVPAIIRFKDGPLLRPVAPFIELWAVVQRTADDGTTTETEQPVTSALLREIGTDTSSIHVTLTMANRKAERRTTSQQCGFTARVEVSGDDHESKVLLGFSPHTPGTVPLVASERPIPLGRLQMIRPLERSALGIDLSVVRLRFTPPKGEVYGTESSTTAMASTVPPGPPQTRLIGRLHEIVQPENRILNDGTPWSTYVWNGPDQVDPQPSDSYDGAHDGTFISWGVVDDTSDGVLVVQLVAGGERFVATSRIISSCPDYAPDRRTFLSFHDDLADRDLDPVRIDDETIEEVEHVVADLFQRVFETVSAINLDAARWFAINENESAPHQPAVPAVWPKLDGRSMTGQDVPYADNVPDLLAADTDGDTPVNVNHDRLPYTRAARAVHGPLTDIDSLIAFMRRDPDRLRRLLRPPFGRFTELPETPADLPSVEFRDPRLLVDTMQDMRMPPYMRDSDENPLSLTWNQYRMVLDFVDYLAAHPEALDAHGPARRAVTRLGDRLSAAPQMEEPNG